MSDVTTTNLFQMNALHSSAGVFWVVLPFAVFVLLIWLEWRWPLLSTPWQSDDWLLNGSGLVVQGVAVPSLALLIGGWLAALLPGFDGLIPGAAAAFLLNFVALDLLYYWQHRWFHAAGWPLHRPHHGAKRLGAWVTSRGALATHFLFVYLLPSSLLSLLCQDKLAYFAAAMLTASLDLWRHSAIRWPGFLASGQRFLAYILITPMAHHLHHEKGVRYSNFGANLSAWDRLFGTYAAPVTYPAGYGLTTNQPAWKQLLIPWQ